MNKKQNMYVTAKHFSITPYGNQFAIGAGSQQIILTDKEEFRHILELAFFCLKPKSPADINQFITKNHLKTDRFQFMLDHYFILTRQIDTSNKYSRNQIYFESLGMNSNQLQNTISSKHILIAGCGGIGTALAYSLASLGVRKLTLIDADIIESSNLNRQFLFTESDLGKLKVTVLKEALLQRNSTISVDIISENLSGLALKAITDPIDCILLSADDTACMPIINHFCVLQRIPYLNIGYLNDISVIGPFYIPYKTACMCCDKHIFGTNHNNEQEKSQLDKVKLVNKRMIAPSSPCNNFMAASMALTDLLFYFNNDFDHINSFNKRVGLNNRDFSRIEIPIRPNKHCSLCQTPRHIC